MRSRSLATIGRGFARRREGKHGRQEGQRKRGLRREIGTKTGQTGEEMGPAEHRQRRGDDDGSGAKTERATGARLDGGREEGKRKRERRRR